MEVSVSRRKGYDPNVRDRQGRKLCTPCNSWLPETEFTKSVGHSDGLFGMCRTCKRVSRHGLTRISFLGIIESQGGGCAICESKEDLVVDHDHSCCSGETSCGECVRGVLCRLCNVAVGQFQEREDLVRSALAYLTKK